MEDKELVRQMTLQMEKKILLGILLIAFIIFIIFSIYFIYKTLYKNKIKKAYLKACKEFNINNVYMKKIKKKFDIYYNYEDYTNVHSRNAYDEPSYNVFKYTNMNNVKTDTWHHYVSQILTDLKIDEFDSFETNYPYTHTNRYYYLKNFKTNNKHRLKIVCNLLHDKHFKYNGFLIENALCLIACLKEPFEQLQNINTFGYSEEEKKVVNKKLEEEIGKAIDSFLEIVLYLHENESKEIDEYKNSLISTKTLEGINKYLDLSNEIKNDIQNKIAIF